MKNDYNQPSLPFEQISLEQTQKRILEPREKKEEKIPPPTQP